uniref:NADH-ubiquinone oxidoreductase chain 2 n=1 Tax=Tectocoris diophthalmus TaxID=159956 RepID=A0A2K9YV31_9HEMI|nr:NADH dehydrogenase subunit 2 [Tectocoris diophthalmus]
MYKSKSMFMIVMMTGTILNLSSTSWISMWMGLEINMMAFIPLINEKNKNSSQSMMIYLLTQSISSTILMFSIVLFQVSMIKDFHNLMLMSLLIKLGAAPFHMWLPEIMTKMSWTSNIILMTWQKVAPMNMINSMSYNNKIMYISIMMSVIVGTLGGLNQLSIRKIMSYSSINHMGWMLSLSKMKNNWLTYLMIYSMMISLMLYMFHKYNMIHINQINSMNLSLSEKLNYSMMMMSIGGMPPLLGFLPKWIAIQTLINSKLFLMMITMTVFSIFSLFYYMRTMTMMMVSSASSNKWMYTKPSSYLINFMMTMNMSMPLIIIINMT